MKPGGPGGYVGGRPKDETKLSTDPAQVRIRLRRAARKGPILTDQMRRDMEVLYQKPIEEWDLEELARGRPRNAKGDFQGSPPRWITPIVVREAKRRLMEHTFGNLAGYVDKAIKTLVDLMESEEVDEKGRPIVDARTRMAAAVFILENVLGKPKAIVEVEASDKTRQVLAAAIMLDDGKPQDFIEGEVIPDDDDTSA
jgi:hypothetical protein